MSSIVLGVSGGVAAYKAAFVLRAFTEAGHDVRVVPTPGRPALRRRGHLRGALRQPGHHRRLVRRPRGRARPHRAERRPRRRRPGHRRPARPRRHGPGRRPAHRHAAAPRPARSSSCRRCTPRCGCTRPRRTTSPPCAAAAPSSCRRPSGRLTGPDSGPGRLPEPADIAALATGRPAARGRRARARPGRPPGRHQRRRHARAAGPGALPGQPLVGQAGLGAGPGRRGPRRRGGPGRRQRRRCRPRSASAVVPGRDGRGAARRRWSPRPPDADVVVMTAAVADFRPETVGRDEAQEGLGEPSRARSPLVRNPDVLAELVDQARAGAAGGRLRRRDRGRRRRRAHPRPGEARPQGLRPAGGQRRLRRSGLRPGRQRGDRARRRRLGHRGRRTAARTPSPRGSGSGRRVAAAPAASLTEPHSVRAPRPVSAWPVAVVPGADRAGLPTRHRSQGVPSATPPLHLRVGHRGPPGQDRRPDQRRDPGRDARAGPAQPGRRRDA